MNGIERIAKERQRQIEELWGDEHDDGHTEYELVRAAACYVIATGDWPGDDLIHELFSGLWPWDEFGIEGPGGKSPEDPIRNLEKAGALIAAEIDRLLRAQDSSPAPTEPAP